MGRQCDQKQPACSRCARLQITCIGAGVRRYQFKEHQLSQPAAKTKQSREVLVIHRTPSNETTLLTSSLIEKMEVKDLRYNVPFACGVVFKDLPQRLGSDPALDAAIIAFTTSLPLVLTCQRSPQMHRRYGNALSRLRTRLANAVQARNASTICAIYLIWLCQVRTSD